MTGKTDFPRLVRRGRRSIDDIVGSIFYALASAFAEGRLPIAEPPLTTTSSAVQPKAAQCQ